MRDFFGEGELRHGDYEHTERVGSFVSNSNAVGLPKCLENGEYRVDLSLNGHHAYSGEISLDVQPYQTASVRDLNMALCHPSNWVPQSLPKVSKGMMRGFANKEKSRGVFVFSFYSSESNPSYRLEETFTQMAERILAESGYVNQAVPPLALKQSCGGFDDAGGLSWEGYQLYGESLFSKTWFTWDGTVYVGLVVRHPSAEDHTIQQEIGQDLDKHGWSAESELDSFLEQERLAQERLAQEDCGVLRSLRNVYGTPWQSFPGSQ
jgi:hypothetical protein